MTDSKITAAMDKVFASGGSGDTGTHLTLYGIDPSDRPTDARFPQVFNSGAHRFWKEVLASKGYTDFSAKQAPGNFEAHWTYLIRAFLKRCESEGVYAFTGKDDFHEMASSFLKHARVRIAEYVKASGILQHLRIASVSRKVILNKQNFSVQVKARLRPVNDPTFEKWLVTLPSPAFSKHRDGVYRKALHAHVELSYEVQKNGDSFLTYTVACVSPIRMMDPKYSSRDKISKYIENKLWLPLVRDHRIADAGNRLF